jgi:hypothetical protein
VNVREVLLGRESIASGRDDRHVLDTLLGRWHLGEAERAQLSAQFAGLLADPDPRVLAAALHWFAEHIAAPDGGALARRAEDAPALVGVPTPWFPGYRDLADVLINALSLRARTDTAARDAARALALLPGRASLAGSLLAHDTAWFLAALPTLLAGTPDLVGMLAAQTALAYRHSAESGEDRARAFARAAAPGSDAAVANVLSALTKTNGAALNPALAELIGVGRDLRGTLPQVRDAVGPVALRAALSTLPDSPEKFAYLALV